MVKSRSDSDQDEAVVLPLKKKSNRVAITAPKNRAHTSLPPVCKIFIGIVILVVVIAVIGVLLHVTCPTTEQKTPTVNVTNYTSVSETTETNMKMESHSESEKKVVASINTEPAEKTEQEEAKNIETTTTEPLQKMEDEDEDEDEVGEGEKEKELTKQIEFFPHQPFQKEGREEKPAIEIETTTSSLEKEKVFICPSGWLLLTDSLKSACVKVFTIRLDWSNAMAYCMRSHKGFLASVHNTSDNQLIYAEAKRLMPEGSEMYGKWDGLWLGGHTNTPERLNTSSWYWIDGSDFQSFMNWAQGEPWNLDSNEKCLGQFTQAHLGGTWNDYKCKYRLPFVCQKPASCAQNCN